MQYTSSQPFIHESTSLYRPGGTDTKKGVVLVVLVRIVLVNLYHHTQTIIIEYTQLISKWGGRMDSMSLHSILSYESQLHGIFLRGLWSQVSAAPIHSCGGSPSPRILLQHETVTVGSQHLLFSKWLWQGWEKTRLASTRTGQLEDHISVVYYVYYLISAFIPKGLRTMSMTCLNGPEI